MPTNHIESAMTLSRVERNDPALRHLMVSNLCVTGEGLGCYWPNNSADLARIGDAIGANTQLQRLDIRSVNALIEMDANNAAFFEGIKDNNSIHHLGLYLDPFLGLVRDILNEVVANNNILTSIELDRCTLGNGGTGILTAALTSCTSLKSIRLKDCSIDDDILEEFVSGIIGLHQLRTLDLSGNNFGRAGCEALATLLKESNSNLCHLRLGRNIRIDDNCATILANALKGKNKLKILRFYPNNTITGRGWDAFSEVLCDTSSVNNTFLSNHRLILENHDRFTTNLSSLLRLNLGTDKKQVATQKILRHHTHLDMKPFLEWDLRVLPVAVSWFNRVRDDARNDESNVDAKKLSSIYQFVRALPIECVTP